MPKYAFTALAEDDTEISGVETATNVSEVRLALLERGIDAVQVVEKKSIWQFEVTRKRVSRKELMHFSRQLAVFLRAGIPIIDGLEVITQDMGDKLLKAALMDIADTLRAGETFFFAASAHPEVFPSFYLGILKSAELTGNLDTVLDQLGDYIERDMEARRKITSALVYPGVVAVMSVVTVVVLTWFVLPRFETFFENLDAKLPLATRILLNLSHFFTTWWFLFAAFAIFVAIGIGVLMRTERGRAFCDVMLFRIPVVGDLLRHAVLERFCRILSSMVVAGVPLPDAMAVTGEGTNNAVYKRGISAARERMLRGEGLSQPLADTGLFPAAAKQMFRVGENTGTLDEQLETAAVYFDRELDYRIKRFTNLFEPAVILLMGIIVGFVAIALVSAMYGIFRQVNV